ncbi:unnamed protein product [Rotaria socialis]|uniref:Cytochrome P450 n=1 Tax=Rotaria socialis TaxID=392032 RepID=A0A818H0U1_9BILA|nr:unnamed protein product [Rotaria socialis]
MIITLLLIATVLAIYLMHIYRSYSFFKNLGIDGPIPTFFLGNVQDFASTKRISISIRNWTQQFGRIYGYFEGHTPVLVVSDPDILDQIFRKHFSKFHSRRQFPLEDRSPRIGVHLFSATGEEWRRQRNIIKPAFSAKDRSPRIGVHLFSATGEEWRRQRNIIKPAFSASKIKRMIPSLNGCIGNLMTKLDESITTEPNGFDIYKLYKSLTMDVIWRCCFGITTDLQNDPNNAFLVRAQQVFARENSTYLTTLLGIFIPELQPCWLSLHSWTNSIKSKLRELLPFGERFIADDPNEWLKGHVEDCIGQALKSSDEPDLLHLMLDATRTTSNNADQQNSTRSSLTLDEVKQNMYLFMVAGYETVSTALAYVTYILVTHPDEQEKLRKHIDGYLSKDTIDNFDVVKTMDYLDWFIRETLRMYPITPIIINRECSEEINVPGLGCISPGTKVTLDMYALHYDNELWGDVDTKIFYPERFSAKCHPLPWVAFGVGQRNCIGMQFALAEIKFAVIRLLQNYEILPSALTNEELELVELVTIAPKQVMVRLKKRTDREGE